MAIMPQMRKIFFLVGLAIAFVAVHGNKPQATEIDAHGDVNVRNIEIHTQDGAMKDVLVDNTDEGGAKKEASTSQPADKWLYDSGDMGMISICNSALKFSVTECRMVPNANGWTMDKTRQKECKKCVKGGAHATGSHSGYKEGRCVNYGTKEAYGFDGDGGSCANLQERANQAGNENNTAIHHRQEVTFRCHQAAGVFCEDICLAHWAKHPNACQAEGVRYH